MKRYLIVVMLCCVSYCVYSQACGSVDGNSVPNTSPNQSKYWVKIFYHILRASNQTGGYSSNQLCDITSKLNQEYNQYGIYVTSVGFDYIDDNNGYNLTPAYNPFSVNTVGNAINIYLVNSFSDLAGDDISGCAQNIPSSAFWMVNRYATGSLAAHELGHCLGLYHTHQGNPLGPNAGTGGNSCMENIDGSNCTSCGDRICDTNASPNLLNFIDASCNYIGPSNYNQNGVPYNPDTHNIMSYSNDDCRNRFSTQQVYAMKNNLANTLSNVVASFPAPTVNAPANVCSVASISCSNLASGYTVSNWITSNSSIATISSDGTLTKVSDGPVTVTAIISQGCANYYATAPVYLGNPSLTKTVNGVVAGTMAVSPGSQYNLAASSSSPGVTFNYNDYAGSGNMTITLYNPNSANTQMYVYSTSTSGQRKVKVMATNSCSTYSEDFVFYVYSSFRTYPNPAKESFTVEFTNSKEEMALPDELYLVSETTQKTVRQVNIKDLFKKKAFQDSGKVDLDVRDLPRGTLPEENDRISLKRRES